MTTPKLTDAECDEIRWTISPLDYVYQEGWADAMIRAGYAADLAAAPRGLIDAGNKLYERIDHIGCHNCGTTGRPDPCDNCAIACAAWRLALNQLDAALAALREYGSNGMTLRQWYAGMAMQALVSHPQASNTVGAEILFSVQAFAMADAMLEEGAKP